MAFCRKCGVQCLDLKVRKAHEEKCKKVLKKKKCISKKSKSKKQTTPRCEHDYARSYSEKRNNGGGTTNHQPSKHFWDHTYTSCLCETDDHDLSAHVSRDGSTPTYASSSAAANTESRIDASKTNEHNYSLPADKKYNCRRCGRKFKYLTRRKLHEEQCWIGRSIKCHKCGITCANHKDLYLHRRVHIIESRGGLQQPPWEREDTPSPWYGLPGDEGKALEHEYNLHKDIILQPDRIGSVVSIYNIPLDNNFTTRTLMNKVKGIFANSVHSFRFNISFSTILRQVETGKFRYFQGYRNNSVLEESAVVSDHNDVNKLEERLGKIDLNGIILRQRENTKYKPVLVTNALMWCFNTNFTLGYEPIDLPDFITKCTSIMSFSSFTKYNKSFKHKDNFCAFRSLCCSRNQLLYETDYVLFEVQTLQLFEEWVTYSKNVLKKTINRKRYKGISLEDIPHFEDCFRVNLQLFEKIDKDTILPVYKSMQHYSENVCMNIYKKHLSLILDFKAYAKKFKCGMCNKMFDRHFSWVRHQKSCENVSKILFKGGFYKDNPTIFEELELVGVYTKMEDRVFPWFIVYDFEAILKTHTEHLGVSTCLTNIHNPISVAVCSNFKGHHLAKCVMNENYGELIYEWFELLDEMHEHITEAALTKWGYILDDLQELIDIWGGYDDGGQSLSEHADESGTDEDSNGASDEYDYADSQMHKLLSALQDKLFVYINRVPIIGFNSSKYDLLLCRTEFTKQMGMYNKSSKDQHFVIKKGETYPSISNDKYVFLDILNYLSPGYSYAHFLKAYNVESSKLFFPYEYITSAEKLNETKIPPSGEAWYSSLKQKSVLDDGFNSINVNYAFVLSEWEKNGMKTLWDLLSWYNKGDVSPFVEAIEKFLVFYFEKNIDVFKVAISTPGIARKMMFSSANNQNFHFAVVDNKNEDLFFKIRNNLAGGPSIIFNRYLKVGSTLIRGIRNNTCETIIGWDAASLYLYCMGLELPTGVFIRRLEKDNYKPEIRDRYMSAYHWMNWLNTHHDKQIKHKLNTGKERRIGPFFIDGYDPQEDIFYEFNGCYVHGHECFMTKKMCGKEKKKKFERTIKREKYISHHCTKLIVMWECEFIQMKSSNMELKRSIYNSRPIFFQKNRGRVDQEVIILGLKNNTLYGFIECDISINNPRETNTCNTEFTNYEYFSEMSPIFCTSEVTYEHFGKHMQEFTDDNNLSKRARILLVGGMSAVKILLHTSLLKWYINHGLKITRIYEVIEFTPNRCFKQFTDTITSARRNAEKDPDKEIIGRMFKNLGNSAFGSLLLDKLKHREIKYVEGREKGAQMVNCERFRKMTTLNEDENLYEVELKKKIIRMNVPVQLGFTILQLAKLRMLEMYYDFIDYFIDRNNFELGEMDTDSLYLAFTKKNIEDLIKPSKKQEFYDSIYNNCSEQNTLHEKPFFIPRKCCDKHYTWDSKTPGVFKVEYEGDELISLNSKCYIGATKPKVEKNREFSLSRMHTTRLLNKICKRKTKSVLQMLKKKRSSRVGIITYNIKISCKGISKRNLRKPLYTYRNVLMHKKTLGGENRGFIHKSNMIYSYKQFRYGFTYFYVKREVQEDGMHTKPLKLSLTPITRT